MSRFAVPKPGIYVPAITFFDSEDKLVPEAQSRYFAYLASTGIHGLIVLGSNAEAMLLSQAERKALVKLARDSVPASFPIIAGVSGHSTAQVKEYIDDAYDAGANYALVLPCSYFGKQTTTEVIKDFFAEIARATPLPIIIYNFPAVCNGVDLDSEIITQIVRSAVQPDGSSTVVAVKLTCGSVAKITRLAATFSPDIFAVFGGQADFLIGGLSAGSAGCITAFGNVFPRTIVRIYNLWMAGHVKEAYRLQQVAALAESPTKAGIANTKYATALFSARYAGVQNAVELARPRAPYKEPNEAMKAWIYEAMKGLEATELADVQKYDVVSEPVLARL